MPLENEMNEPKSFISNFGILNIGMGINIILYVSMGLFGYIWHGKGVDGTITKNLPKDEILSTIVQILLAISIFITHSLQCYVAIDISWNEYIQPQIKHISTSIQLLVEYVVRSLIVIITCK
jgi:proton-coupled amino acid transporter